MASYYIKFREGKKKIKLVDKGGGEETVMVGYDV